MDTESGGEAEPVGDAECEALFQDIDAEGESVGEAASQDKERDEG